MRLSFWTYTLSLLLLLYSLTTIAQPDFTLRNDRIELTIDQYGNLLTLKNRQTGHNYASGRPLWRLYYDRKDWKDNEVRGTDNQPVVREEGGHIVLIYNQLRSKRERLNARLTLTVTLEPTQVQFTSEIVNNEPHSIIRELQYPLVANCQLPADHQLLTTYWGGQLYREPKAQIRTANATFPPYYPPSQQFLQMDQRYPTGWGGGGLASNCFAFVGADQGLYLGSHDPTYEDTGHGLRLYPSQKFVFDQLEAGVYKYPNCGTGQTWRCVANVIAPYSGTWHQTATLYRAWVNTWWKHRPEPDWVRRMNGWQRIIMKHQYGEVLFPYTDLGTRVKTVGEGVGLSTVLVHGWHQGGHDNDYPNYIADPKQGSEATLKKQIAEFQKDGGAAIWYYSGRLIDKASNYYRNGPGKQLAIRDNTGSEVNDAYRFRGPGTFTGVYDSRTFTVADFRNPLWQNELKKMADQTVAYGARSVFYDQMGWGEQPYWNLNGAFPVPYLRSIADKSKILGQIHDYLNQKDPNVAIGIELLTDITAMQVDYIHSRYGATDVLNSDWETRGEKPRTTNFIDWFRYTFPEIIMSDRDIRDDTDIERRVNHTVLKGLRNDVEIYRCRALIDEAPRYQAYLTQVNALKTRFADLLLLGRYTDTQGFRHSNNEVEARRFEFGNKAAIVLTQSHLSSTTTSIDLPDGYRFSESGQVGNAKIDPGGNKVLVTLPKHGLAVVTFTKLN